MFQVKAWWKWQKSRAAQLTCVSLVLPSLMSHHRGLGGSDYLALSTPSFFLDVLDSGHCRKCPISSILHAKVHLQVFAIVLERNVSVWSQMHLVACPAKRKPKVKLPVSPPVMLSWEVACQQGSLDETDGCVEWNRSRYLNVDSAQVVSEPPVPKKPLPVNVDAYLQLEAHRFLLKLYSSLTDGQQTKST